MLHLNSILCNCGNFRFATRRIGAINYLWIYTGLDGLQDITTRKVNTRGNFEI